MLSLLLLGVALQQPKLLHVQGNQLAYGGQTVRLRGVCTGDVLLARGPERTGDYQTIAKDWKANVVRIGVAPPSWKRKRSETLAALKKDIAAALQQRMFVIIDWHTIGWPDGYYQIPTWEGTDKDLYDSSFSLATDFWRTCAREFGKDGRIAFQLWCEPLYTERDWETPLGSTWAKIKPYFQRLTDVIRGEKAPNLILASGNRWAYDLNGIRQSLLPDENTAYEWHVYGGHDNNDPKRWAEKLDALHTVRPVLVTEWGFQADTTSHYKGTEQNFGRPFLEFMESRRMSWTAWCWHPTWGPAMLKEDWKTPTPFGAFVKASLERLNRNAVRP